MSDSSQHDRLRQLREEIREHDQRYYVEARPVISDTQYDALMKELEAIESEHPEWIVPDSPSQRIGDAPVDHLPKVQHRAPMLSIENTFSLDGLREFGQRTVELLEDEAVEWVVEYKIDGVAAAAVYEQGVLVRGATRGNGKVGDDVTHNLRTVADVPLRLLGEAPPLLEVRGEVYMTNQDLAALNRRQAERGLEPFANTRNVTAGAIRLLDPRVCAERSLRMFCHGAGYCEGLEVDTYAELLDMLPAWGLAQTPLAKVCSNLDEAIQYSEELAGRIHELPFEVDGIVLKVNRFDQRERLGVRSKSPRWVVAYKWEKYEAVTKLEDIRVHVGRSGAVTPYACLKPVQLAGTTVSRSTLHNLGEIRRKDLRVGDMVVVEKAGKIIPHIVRAELQERKSELPEYEFPDACPQCDQPLVQDEGEAVIRCTNPECPAKLRERVYYFASRGAMDINGLGDKLVNQLVNAGLVTHYADLYSLSVDELTKLERIGQKSAEKLVDAIADSRDRGLAAVLTGLSIRHVGARVAEVLAESFPDIDALKAASVEELAATPDVGDVIARSVHDFLHSERGWAEVEALREAGVDLSAVEQAPATRGSGGFEGMTIVVTGALATMTRDEAHALIKQLGGKPSSSVSNKTSFLVAGAKAGSKLAKAKRLEVPVLKEEEFRERAAAAGRKGEDPDDSAYKNAGNENQGESNPGRAASPSDNAKGAGSGSSQGQLF